MNKKLFIFFVLALMAVCLTGCMPTFYSKETEKQIANLIEEETTQWFRENMPDAKITDMEMFEVEYGYLSWITCGHYEKDGESIYFCYDTKENLFYNSILYDEAIEEINKQVVETFIQDEYEMVKQMNDISFAYPTVRIKESDKKSNKGDLEELPGIMLAKALPLELKKEELSKEMESVLQTNNLTSVWPKIFFKEDANIEEIDVNPEVFTKMPELNSVSLVVKKAPDYNGLVSITYSYSTSDDNTSLSKSFNYAISKAYNKDLYARYSYSDKYFLEPSSNKIMNQNLAEDDLRNGRIEFHTCDELGKESSDGDCFFITSNERSNTIFLNNEQSLFSIRYDKEGKKQINEVRGEVFETDEKYNCYYSSFTRREDGTFISDIFYCK